MAGAFPPFSSKLTSEQTSLQRLDIKLAAIVILQPFFALSSVNLIEPLSCHVQMGDMERHHAKNTLQEQMSHRCFSHFTSLRRRKVSKGPYRIEILLLAIFMSLLGMREYMIFCELKNDWHYIISKLHAINENMLFSIFKLAVFLHKFPAQILQ